MISTRRHFNFFASFVQSSFGTHAGHVSRRQMSRFFGQPFFGRQIFGFREIWHFATAVDLQKEKKKNWLGSAEGADWPGAGHVTPAAAIIGQVERLRHRLVVTRVTFFGFSKISCCQTSKFHLIHSFII